MGKTGISGDFFFFGWGKEPQDSWKNWDLLNFFFGGRTPKIVGKTGISGEIFCGKDHQDSGKNWDLWRFFFFGGGRTTKIVGKTGISGVFLGGRTPR